MEMIFDDMFDRVVWPGNRHCSFAHLVTYELPQTRFRAGTRIVTVTLYACMHIYRWTVRSVDVAAI